MNIFDRASVKRAAWRVIRGQPAQKKTPQPSEPEPETGTLSGILIIFFLAFIALAVLITLFNW